MGNNCSLVSPRQDGMVLIRHPYKLEKFNKYLDSKNVFRIVSNEVTFDNVKKVEEQSIFQGVKKDNNFCELDLDLGETGSQDNNLMKHKYKLPSAIEKDCQISDKECIGKFTKCKNTHKHTHSNKGPQKKTCVSCNKLFIVNNNNNNTEEDCVVIDSTSPSKNTKHKRRTSLTLHKPNNNTLLINYCSNTYGHSKQKLSAQNTHERINTAITAVSSNNLSDVSSSSNNQNKSNSSSKDKYIYPNTNKLFANNLSDIKSSIEEINSNSINDNIHLTKQLALNEEQLNEHQLSPRQALQITNNNNVIHSQTEKEFIFPKSNSTNEQCSTSSSHQKETANKESKPSNSEHPHSPQQASPLSQVFSLNNNNNLIFSKLHSEQNVQFSIVDTNNNNSMTKLEPLSPSMYKAKPKTVSTKTVYSLNSLNNKDNETSNNSSLANAKSNLHKGTKDKQRHDKKMKNVFFKKIILGSELKKVSNIADKVSYANRYCVLTASDLHIYKTKEDFVLVKPPLLIISLLCIVNVNVFILNKNQNKDKMHHFVIKYNNNSNKDISKSLDVSSSELNQDNKDDNVEVEFFGSKDLRIIKQWIKEIKYWKNNA